MKFTRIIAAAIALAAAPFIMAQAPAHASKTVVIIGDSISSYVHNGQARDLSWSLITQERDVLFRNLSQPGAQLGHPGYWTPQAVTGTLDRLCGWQAINCDAVIVQAGINDYQFGTSWAAYVDTLQAVIDWGSARGKPVLILDLLWAGAEDVANGAGRTLGDYRTHRYFMGLTYAHVHFLSRPSAFDHENPALTAPDGIHPNVAGHRALADWLEAEASSLSLF